MTPLSAERTSLAPARGASAWQRNASTFLVVAALALAAFVYLWFIRVHCAYYASSSDASGYFNVARLLRSGELVQSVPRIEGLSPPAWDFYYQQPLGFLVNSAHGTMVTTYPVGLPLHFLAAAPLVGMQYAALAVNLFLAAAAGLFMIALGRQFGLPWIWAAAGAALLWACPLFILFVTQPMSDVCATVWTLAVFSFAFVARRRWAWGFIAGAAFAMAVLVRPTDLLLIVPVAWVLGVNGRTWLAFVAGGLPGAVFLGWFNQTLYGAILTTGYGSIDNIIGWRFVPHNVGHFALWIFLLLSPFVVVPAVFAPRVLRESRRTLGLLALWCAAFVGFYVFYFHSGETWWYLRFILPIFPAIIFAALLTTHRWFSRLPCNPWRKWVPIVLLTGALIWEFNGTRRLVVTQTKDGDRPYLQTAEWARTHLPSNAILMQMQVSGSFTYYTTFTLVRWDLLNPAAWDQLRAAARAARRPIYATLFDFEEARAFPKILTGKWERVTQIRQISVWRLVDSDSPPAS